MLLLDLLELYGKNFEYSTYGISVSGGGSHFPLVERKIAGTASLVIIDPFNPINNVGQQVIGMGRIKIIMEDVHKTLISPFYSTFTPATPILHRVIKPEFILKNEGKT